MKGYIHSQETFGTVDGPGIRFVLFLKGCPMRCLYCHNPDTWTMDNASMKEPQEIVDQVKKYRNYYKNGGVTISGGEPLLQLDFLIELTTLLQQENFHVAVDTSGCLFDYENQALMKKFDELIKHVDLFMLDIKHIDNEEHIKLTSKSNVNILEFARYLDKHGKKMWIRHVLVPNITAVDQYLTKLKAFIDTLTNVENVEILPYHTLGISKYEQLGIPYPLKGVEPPSKEQIERAKSILSLNRRGE